MTEQKIPTATIYESMPGSSPAHHQYRRAMSTMEAVLRTAPKPYLLLIVDLDGCLVKTFDGKGLNQAAYADRIAHQPVNRRVAEQILFLKSHHPQSKLLIITGRKQSLLGEITENQLEDLIPADFLPEIIFYPEDKGYDPIGDYHRWKLGEITKAVATLNAHHSEVVIVEDDLTILQGCQSYTVIPPYIKRTFWVVVKDAVIIPAKELWDVTDA